jgi:SAM-dependent methyltransferase
MTRQPNLDADVVEGFGDEWSRFDSRGMTPEDLRQMFDQYFAIFPWSALPAGAIGFDLGCGTGRWARLVAPRVGTLHCIDPSAAIDVARRNLAGQANCVFHRAGVDGIPLDDASADFGYALGVLHHLPDTEAGLASCTAKLKEGAPFLLYLYYRFDNRAWWYVFLWRLSELLRRPISRLPHPIRYALSQILALTVYWPVARLAALAERAGLNARSFPLAYYRHRSFYVMRLDALDRFGTRLERRFTRAEIEGMMTRAGLTRIRFSEGSPFWTAVGYKA